MTNFDKFAAEPTFASFAKIAVSAERIFQIDPAACVLNCRRAMEFAVKWMYSVDGELQLPWDDKLVSLMSTDEFRGVVDGDLLRRMDFIRKLGNTAAHDGRKISREQAALCLENLYIFLDFVAYCYGENYEERAFDANLLNPIATAPPVGAPRHLIRRLRRHLPLKGKATLKGKAWRASTSRR